MLVMRYLRLVLEDYCQTPPTPATNGPQAKKKGPEGALFHDGAGRVQPPEMLTATAPFEALLFIVSVPVLLPAYDGT